jgi:nicotinamide-nucleotide amidase
VEVVTVGTELLLGDLVNSNAAAIGRRLADEGFDTHYQVVVGDNLERLVATLSTALERADAVVITGGIGPTQDDLTREALCELAGVPMVRDHEHATWIDARIRAQGRQPAPNVMRMADLPEGAQGLRNANGVALGVALRHAGVWLYAMPGVPPEMIPMLDHEVLPRLRAAAGEPAVLRSKVLHSWGLGESTVSDLLDDLFASHNPSVAFLIKDMEVRVRITAKAEVEAAALALIEPMEREVRQRLGEAVFAEDDETVEQIVLASLARLGWTVATVERATLGQIGARLRAADRGGSRFAGTTIPRAGHSPAPDGDVVVEVGEIGPDTTPGTRTTRPVSITVTTPRGSSVRGFEFGGDDERLRSFAAIAGLHVLRAALETSRSG